MGSFIGCISSAISVYQGSKAELRRLGLEVNCQSPRQCEIIRLHDLSQWEVFKLKFPSIGDAASDPNLGPYSLLSCLCGLESLGP